VSSQWSKCCGLTRRSKDRNFSQDLLTIENTVNLSEIKIAVVVVVVVDLKVRALHHANEPIDCEINGSCGKTLFFFVTSS